MVAMADHNYGARQAWKYLVKGIDEQHDRHAVFVAAALWRMNPGIDTHPNVWTGDRIIIVYKRVVRGHCILADPPVHHETYSTLHLDLTTFVPATVEWAYGPSFRRSWRPCNFTEPCLMPFPDWREHPGFEVIDWLDPDRRPDCAAPAPAFNAMSLRGPVLSHAG